MPLSSPNVPGNSPHMDPWGPLLFGIHSIWYFEARPGLDLAEGKIVGGEEINARDPGFLGKTRHPGGFPAYIFDTKNCWIFPSGVRYISPRKTPLAKVNRTTETSIPPRSFVDSRSALVGSP